MARLELKGITNETKDKVKSLAKLHGVSVATYLEPVLKRHFKQPDTRDKLIRYERSDPDW
jgi:hypothetical protein